jgi:Mg2+ and Co2+ transporter CorA
VLTGSGSFRRVYRIPHTTSLTMIAGIHGMSFTYMPELQWEYGYHLSLATMVVACGWL